MENKKKKRSLIFAILLLAVVFTTAGVWGTYARYVTKDSGDGTATVAKWAAEISGWEGESTSQTLTLTPVANPYVASDVIAPDTDAVGILDIDLTGTEVATDLMAGLGNITVNGATVSNAANHFTTVVRIYAADTTDEAIQKDIAGITGGATPLATLENSTQKYFLALDGDTLATPKVRIAVGFKWVHNDSTEGWNDWDTALGAYEETAPTITATLNVIAQQHVLSDGEPN